MKNQQATIQQQQQHHPLSSYSTTPKMPSSSSSSRLPEIKLIKPVKIEKGLVKITVADFDRLRGMKPTPAESAVRVSLTIEEYSRLQETACMAPIASSKRDYSYNSSYHSPSTRRESKGRETSSSRYSESKDRETSSSRYSWTPTLSRDGSSRDSLTDAFSSHPRSSRYSSSSLSRSSSLEELEKTGDEFCASCGLPSIPEDSDFLAVGYESSSGEVSTLMWTLPTYHESTTTSSRRRYTPESSLESSYRSTTDNSDRKPSQRKHK